MPMDAIAAHGPSERVYSPTEAGRVVAPELKQRQPKVKLARDRETRSSTPEGADSGTLTGSNPCQSRC